MTNFVQPITPAYPAGVAGVYDYPSLKQAVQDWYARSDIASYIDYFVQLAETDIYRDVIATNMGRGTRDMEASLSTTVGASPAPAGQAPLPIGYLGLKIGLVSVSGQTYEMQRVTPEFIYTQYPDQSASGTPAYISRLGSNFIFGPFPDSAYAISGIYWKKSLQLTVTNTVTWMTSAIPTVLLAATNRAVARFVKDEEAFQLWDSLYNQQLASYVSSDRAEELSGSALAMVAT
jgi:hypothetical protein